MAYWRRRVVEACIYGVDLNPLAVELAELSLWLTTISSDQPLNFWITTCALATRSSGRVSTKPSSLPAKKASAGAGRTKPNPIHLWSGTSNAS